MYGACSAGREGEGRDMVVQPGGSRSTYTARYEGGGRAKRGEAEAREARLARSRAGRQAYEAARGERRLTGKIFLRVRTHSKMSIRRRHSRVQSRVQLR